MNTGQEEPICPECGQTVSSLFEYDGVFICSDCCEGREAFEDIESEQ